MNLKSNKYQAMNIQQNGFPQELELSYLNEPETDVRRDPNYALLLLLIIVSLFGVALAAIFIFDGQVPFF
jgi:hypothetical protein